MCLTLAAVGCSRRPVVSTGVSPTIDETEPVVVAGHFEFPSDRGGQLLAELLTTPGNKEGRQAEDQPGPQRFPESPAVRVPELPLTPVETGPPRLLPASPARPFLPEVLPEDAPFAHHTIEAGLPETPRLVAASGVRLPSAAIDRVPALPILAAAHADRAPLDDLTWEVSLGAALAAPFPGRLLPAPFMKFILPDPFEHRETARLQQPRAENQPPASSSRLPK
jgi:hypothetical protein